MGSKCFNDKLTLNFKPDSAVGTMNCLVFLWELDQNPMYEVTLVSKCDLIFNSYLCRIITEMGGG